MHIGILALQGAVEPHKIKLKDLGAQVTLVRQPQHLENLDGLVLPGGESTTMIHLLKLNQLWELVRQFAKDKPTWGICAGAILLAKDVKSPAQESLQRMDISVERNAYGRQVESFIGEVRGSDQWPGPTTLEGVFIRAPRITRIGGKVTPLLYHGDQAVMVRQEHLLASSFHPELSQGHDVHQYFLRELCSQQINRESPLTLSDDQPTSRFSLN